MDVRVTIPDDIAAQLQPSGGDLGRRALEALAVDGYRAERLSLGQVAKILALSIDQADRFLKDRSVPLLATKEEFEQDQARLEKLLSQ